MFSTERSGSFEITHLPRLGMALNHLAKGGVDIVLLDLGLPDGNGLDTVRRVRQIAPDVPLVVITGRDDEATVAEAMLEGAQDYLVKGQIENHALPRALRHAIERFRLLRRQTLTNIELERRVREKDLLLSEIHHRVKNSLQVVSSLLSLGAASIHDPFVLEVLRTTESRIRSMAIIHQTLYQSRDFAHVDFHAFLQSFVPTLIQSYSIHPESILLALKVAEVQLPIDAAIPCGLIVNELVSNALKHAFPNSRSGTISIEFAQNAGNQASLCVTDNGAGLPDDFDAESSGTLGIQLVQMLAGQLGGTLAVSHLPQTSFLLRFPLCPDPLAPADLLTQTLIAAPGGASETAVQVRINRQ
jgi:two-component sensor histidine kinase